MKKLGKTNIETEGMGFGLCFSNPKDNPEDLILKAYEKGIKFFDTAKVYRTETYLGNLIKEGKINRKDIYISTKTKYLGDNKQFFNDLGNSLVNLHTIYVDLFFIHSGLDSIEDYTRARDEGIFEDLRNMPNIVKHIGISGHDLKATEMAIDDGLVDVIMIQHSILYKDFEPLIKKAKEKGIGVITMKNLASGILAGGPNRIFGSTSHFTNLFSYELNNAGADMIIPSARTMIQLKQNLLNFKAVEIIGKLPYIVEHLWEKDIKETLGDICTSCHYCRPCKHHDWRMSQPNILRYLTYKEKFGIDTSEEYNKLKLNIKDCPEDCDCSITCPLGLNIKELMQEAHDKLCKGE